MKKIIFSLHCLLLCGIITCFAAPLIAKQAKQTEQSLDSIVATVNDDIITQSEFQQALTATRKQLIRHHIALPKDKVLQKQVLDQIINKKLQLQTAKQAGIEVPIDELDTAIARIAKENKLSVAALYQQAEQEGLPTKAYRRELHEQLIIQKLQQQELLGRVTVTPQEVNDFLQSQTWQNNGSKEYRLQDILIPLKDAPSAEEIAAARKKANAILVKLKQGKSFQTTAIAESGDNHALTGGDLGWRKLPEIPSAFAEHVTKMQKNDIAGPIQTPNGFHIIRLEGVRSTDGSAAAPDRKQVEQWLVQRKFEELLQNWISKLRSQAFIVTHLNG